MTRFRARAAATLAIAPALVSFAACASKTAPLTQLVTVIDSDLVVPAQVDEVEVVAVGPAGKALVTRVALTSSPQSPFPLTLSLVPGSDAAEQVTVSVTAKLLGAPVLGHTARMRFVADQSRSFTVSLNRACLGVRCAASTTCDGAGACAPIDVPESHLAGWMNSVPPHGTSAELSGALVVDLGLGETHSCALTRAGAVLCWGANESCELGTTLLGANGVGRLVPGVDDGVALASASAYSCVLHVDKTVSCWGLDENGQLGDGLSGRRLTRAEPTPVAGLAKVVQISTGDAHACAVDDGGAVWCWGGNARGQIGDGTTTDRSVPTKVTGLGGAVAEVAAAELHTCARLVSGQIQCWGGNEYGQIGSGAAGADARTPQSVSALYDAVELTVGAYHTCVVRKPRVVSCWGRNDRGQLGDGTTTDRAAPLTVAALDDVRDVVAGKAHSCARTEAGAIACWGANDFGQLGTGSSTDSAKPIALAGIHADRLRAGNYHTCSGKKSEAVVCWGRNDRAQLGDGTTQNHASPTPTIGLP